MVLTSTLAIKLLSTYNSSSSGSRSTGSGVSAARANSGAAGSSADSTPISIALGRMTRSVFCTPVCITVRGKCFRSRKVRLALMANFKTSGAVATIVSNRTSVKFVKSRTSVCACGRNTGSSIIGFTRLARHTNGFLITERRVGSFG